MNPITYLQLKQLAAFLAGRADDTTGTNLKLSVSEGAMLLAFFAAELPDLWHGESWPELCDNLAAVTVTDRMFSAAGLGRILNVFDRDPRVHLCAQRVEWSPLNGRVNVVTCLGSVWVESQDPVPDLLTGTTDATTLPHRFLYPLACRGAALLVADEDISAAGALRGLASANLDRQSARIQKPWWRS